MKPPLTDSPYYRLARNHYSGKLHVFDLSPDSPQLTSKSLCGTLEVSTSEFLPVGTEFNSADICRRCDASAFPFAKGSP